MKKINITHHPRKFTQSKFQCTDEIFRRRGPPHLATHCRLWPLNGRTGPLKLKRLPLTLSGRGSQAPGCCGTAPSHAWRPGQQAPRQHGPEVTLTARLLPHGRPRSESLGRNPLTKTQHHGAANCPPRSRGPPLGSARPLPLIPDRNGIHISTLRPPAATFFIETGLNPGIISPSPRSKARSVGDRVRMPECGTFWSHLGQNSPDRRLSNDAP